MSGELSEDDVFARASALFDARRPAEALEVLGPLRATGGGTARAHLLAARCLVSLGRPEEALVTLWEAIRADPTWAYPFVLRSHVLKDQGHLALARDAAAEALRLAPRSASAHLAMAYALSGLGDRTAALEHADLAVAEAPAWAPAHLGLSVVHLGARRWRDAEAAARRALALDPTSGAAMNNLGVALRHQWRPFAAIRMFGDSNRADPQGRISQANTNAAFLRLAGWILCLVVATVVLTAWSLTTPSPLDTGPLTVLLAVTATATVVAVTAGVRWFLRQPRAVRNALSDGRAWGRTFGRTERSTWGLVGLVVWHELLFFGAPLYFALLLVWRVLWVAAGSERAAGQTASGALVVPVVWLGLCLVLRNGRVLTAVRRRRGRRGTA